MQLGLQCDGWGRDGELGFKGEEARMGQDASCNSPALESVERDVANGSRCNSLVGCVERDDASFNWQAGRDEFVAAVWTRVYNWTQESKEELGEKKRVGNVDLPGLLSPKTDFLGNAWASMV